MPDAPVSILPEPSAGSPPSAPPAVLSEPSAGSPPSAPVVILAEPSAGSPPAAPVEILEPYIAGSGVVVLSWPGETYLGELLSGTYEPNGTLNGRTKFLSSVNLHEFRWQGSPINRWEYFTPADVAIVYSDSDVLTPGLAEDWKDAADDTPIATFTTSEESGVTAPPAVLSEPSAGSPPSSPVVILAEPSAGSPPTAPAAVLPEP